MRRSVLVAVAVLATALGACRAGPGYGNPDPGPGTPAGNAGQGTGRRGMGMGGTMGGMHGRMMGGGGAGEAPAATAASATAEDCPDVTQALVDQGRAVFTGSGSCFACHGSDATGTALAPNLTDGDWLNVDGSYQAVAGLIRTGVPEPKQHPAPMPPKGGADLSDAQVCAVAAYVYSLSH